MKSKIFWFALATCLLFGCVLKVNGQDDILYVSQAWGIVFGNADTTNDFLIYDACRPDADSSLIFIVGRSTKIEAFEQKQGSKDTYFHTKDSFTDAFLACFSIRGELLWTTYLPSPDSNHLNGFASCVRAFGDTIAVVVNSYNIENDPKLTRQKIPLGKGNLCIFEFNIDGTFLRSQTFVPRYQYRGAIQDYPFVPRIFSIDRWIQLHLSFPGIA